MEMIVEIHRVRSFESGEMEFISDISIKGVMERIAISYKIPRKIDEFIKAYYEAEGFILAFMNESIDNGNQFQEGLLGRLVIEEQDFNKDGTLNIEKVVLKIRELLPVEDALILDLNKAQNFFRNIGQIKSDF